MEKTIIKFETLNMAVKCGLYQEPQTINAVMNLKDGSRMTTTLYVFNDPTGKVLVNISKCATYEFENEEEFKQYLNKKFIVFKNEKDMYQSFMGWDDETWNEWNK